MSEETAGRAIQTLLDVLDLQQSPADEPDSYVGGSLRQPWGRIFGGQVLAQALLAAIRTVDPDRAVHSLHAYFLRPGDPEVPIRFTVERLRDGRSFSARRTEAAQHGRPILFMTSSYQLAAAGLEHQAEMPDVPGPESLPALEEVLRGVDRPEVKALLSSRPVDIRHVDGSLFLGPVGERRSSQAVWMRTIGRLPDDSTLQTAVLAFISDYTLLESALRRHGLAWGSPGLRTASLDHAMWFHRPARVDDWLLYVQESPSAQSARGLGTGRFFTRAGIHVATVAQEGMMRLPENQLPAR